MALSNKRERKEFWDEINSKYSQAEIKEVMDAMKPAAQIVIHMHYQQGIPLKDIGPLIGRTMTVVRDRESYGIHQLYKHFNPRKEW